MPKAKVAPKKKPIVLSICIPAYNEQKTLEQIVKKVQEVKFPFSVELDMIIVNDCSKDDTLVIANKLAKKYGNIRVLTNEKNLGKSQTLRKAFMNVRADSDYAVCQDADLEYDPNDLVYMLERLVHDQYDVAYGNRFGHYTDVLYKQNFYGNLFLSMFSSLFTTPRIKVMLPDMEVCYKMIRSDVARKVAKKIKSTSNFGIEPEMTARLSKYKIKNRNLKFVVTPTNYYPRSVSEGKKMKAFHDGSKAFLEILKFNLFAK